MTCRMALEGITLPRTGYPRSERMEVRSRGTDRQRLVRGLLRRPGRRGAHSTKDASVVRCSYRRAPSRGLAAEPGSRQQLPDGFSGPTLSFVAERHYDQSTQRTLRYSNCPRDRNAPPSPRRRMPQQPCRRPDPVRPTTSRTPPQGRGRRSRFRSKQPCFGGDHCRTRLTLASIPVAGRVRRPKSATVAPGVAAAGEASLGVFRTDAACSGEMSAMIRPSLVLWSRSWP